MDRLTRDNQQEAGCDTKSCAYFDDDVNGVHHADYDDVNDVGNDYDVNTVANVDVNADNIDDVNSEGNDNNDYVNGLCHINDDYMNSC